MSSRSIIEFFPEESTSVCGYCNKGDSTSVKKGMWAHTLTVDDYQNLGYRNWRRSGKYCYKPTMDKTCCPQYMIRCDTSQFTPSKHQKKAIKRVNKFLLCGISKSGTSIDNTGNHASKSETFGPSRSNQPEPTSVADQSKVHGSSSNQPEALPSTANQLQTSPSTSNQAQASPSTANQSRAPLASAVQSGLKIPVKPGKGADLNKPPCRKAKELRRERKLEKTRQKNAATSCHVPQSEKPSSCSEKSLSDLLSEYHPEGAKHKLQLRLVRSCPASSEFESTKAEELSIYQKYQMKVHGDKLSDVSMKQFHRFLIDSPLKPEERGKVSLGSFHYQYLLDGRIVAVEVLDILPEFVSSVYFFFDPEFNFLSLGVYSALRSINLVRELSVHLPSLRYYLMGFYIHECPKMRYKGQFSHSYLLCPETYDWVKLEICASKLDESKYSRLTGDLDKFDTDFPMGSLDYQLTTCLYQGQQIPYLIIEQIHSGQDNAKVKDYCKLVGKALAQSILFYVHPY